MPIAPSEVATHRRARMRQPLQAEDEEDRGDQIGDVDERQMSLIARYFFLNMPSMRWVTRKPPTTLIVASTTAMKPSTVRASFGVADREHRADDRDAGDRVRCPTSTACAAAAEPC